jgi:hypothetical protein
MRSKLFAASGSFITVFAWAINTHQGQWDMKNGDIAFWNKAYAYSINLKYMCCLLTALLGERDHQ